MELFDVALLLNGPEARMPGEPDNDLIDQMGTVIARNKNGPLCNAHNPRIIVQRQGLRVHTSAEKVYAASFSVG